MKRSVRNYEVYWELEERPGPPEHGIGERERPASKRVEILKN